MPEILATWQLSQQQRPQTFTSRTPACSSTTTMISAQASAAAANTALEDQGHEYKTVRKCVKILHASLHTMGHSLQPAS